MNIIIRFVKLAQEHHVCGRTSVLSFSRCEVMDYPTSKTRREKNKQVRNSALKFVAVSAGLALLLMLILCFVMISVKGNYVQGKPAKENVDDPTGITAERIVYAESRQSTRGRKLPPPQPFGTVFHGPPPMQFTPSVVKTTTPRYPQLNEYRHRLYPNSIQDIIAYMTSTKVTSTKPLNNRDVSIFGPNYREPQEQSFIEQRYNYTRTTPFNAGDIFHSYKPQDPSDINLLATGKWRFAPPIWKTLKRKPQKNNQPLEENSNKQEIYNGKLSKMPIVISLNIYPFNADLNQKRRRKPIPYRIRAVVPKNNKDEGETTQETMVIHLNVYPNNIVVNENAQESRLRGNFIGFIKEGDKLS